MGGTPRRAVLLALVAALTVATDAHGATRWTPAEPLESASGPFSHDLLTTGAGHHVALWNDDRGLRGTVRTTAGPASPSTDLGRFGWDATMAPTAGGGAILVRAENFTITARDIAPDGTFGPPQPVVAEGQHGSSPSVASNATGLVAVTYSRYDHEQHRASLMVTLRRAGVWSPPAVMVEDLGPAADIKTALTSDGRVVAAWLHQTENATARVRTATWSSAAPLPATPASTAPLSNPGFQPGRLSLAVDGRGRAVLAWLEVPASDSPGTQLVTWGTGTLKLSRAEAGSGFGPPTVIAEQDAREPEVALAEDGETFVAYGRAPDTHPYGPAVVRTAEWGAPLGPPVQPGGDTSAEMVQLAVNDAGEAVVAYRTEPWNLPRSVIEGARRDAGGQWEGAQDLRTPCSYKEAIILDDLTISPKGRAAALLRRYDGPPLGVEIALDEPSATTGPRRCIDRYSDPVLYPNGYTGPAGGPHRPGEMPYADGQTDAGTTGTGTTTPAPAARPRLAVPSLRDGVPRRLDAGVTCAQACRAEIDMWLQPRNARGKWLARRAVRSGTTPRRVRFALTKPVRRAVARRRAALRFVIRATTADGQTERRVFVVRRPR